MAILQVKIFRWILKFLCIKPKNTSSEQLSQKKFKCITSIEMLPNEILARIFKNLPIKDLNLCFKTSRRWRNIANMRLHDYLKQPDSLQIVSKQEINHLAIFSSLNEDRSGGVLICMPNGLYIFGGSEFSANPIFQGPLTKLSKNPSKNKNGPTTSKVLENGSQVWIDGPDFPQKMYPKPCSIQDLVKDYTSFEFSAGHKISHEEFIVVLNRHVFKFNIESKVWSYFVKLKHSRRHSCSLVFDGKLIIAGGLEIPHENVLHKFEVVDLSSGQSWIRENLHIPKVGFKMHVCILDGKPRIVTFGGKREDGEELIGMHDIEIWSEESQSWKLRMMPTKVFRFILGLDDFFGNSLCKFNRILIFKNFHLYHNYFTNCISLDVMYPDVRRIAELIDNSKIVSLVTSWQLGVNRRVQGSEFATVLKLLYEFET